MACAVTSILSTSGRAAGGSYGGSGRGPFAPPIRCTVIYIPMILGWAQERKTTCRLTVFHPVRSR